MIMSDDGYTEDVPIPEERLREVIATERALFLDYLRIWKRLRHALLSALQTPPPRSGSKRLQVGSQRTHDHYREPKRLKTSCLITVTRCTTLSRDLSGSLIQDHLSRAPHPHGHRSSAFSGITNLSCSTPPPSSSTEK